jgi:succinyl-CoA synthetase beta subunit/citryl-CoA synthetase large subunit
MRFYEYESKALLAKHGLPLPTGSRLVKTGSDAARTVREISGPVVLKSQVLTGGRMKAGGIAFVDTPDEAETATQRILDLDINGQRPIGVLVEGRAPVAHEYYVAVTYDDIAKKPIMIFSDMGGIDIEDVSETHPERIARSHFSSLIRFSEYQARQLVASLGITGPDLNRLTQIVVGLVRIFIRYDLTLAEINPLGRLEDGFFACLDGRIDMESEACYRQKAILEELGIHSPERRQARSPTPFEVRGAEIDAADHQGTAGRVVEFDGNLGLIIGGGGGSLTLFDAVRTHGGRPANYCEIGGNPSVSKTCELTKLILSKPGVAKIAVMLNIVSNTRVDLVARGVIKGVIESGQVPSEKIAVFRIPGSWEEEGLKILRKYGVEYCDRTVSMYQAAGQAVARLQES